MSKFINNNSGKNDVVNSNEPHSEYSDHIYVKESDSKEVLFDRNNPLVKMILLALGLVSFLGVLYYVFVALGS